MIHEGQLTYEAEGLQRCSTSASGGCSRRACRCRSASISSRRDLGERLRDLSAVLRDSIRAGLANRAEAMRYAMRFGRGIDAATHDRFVGMYVNELTATTATRAAGRSRSCCAAARRSAPSPSRFGSTTSARVALEMRRAASGVRPAAARRRGVHLQLRVHLLPDCAARCCVCPNCSGELLRGRGGRRVSRAVVLSAVRTPIGRYGGALAGVRPDDLAATRSRRRSSAPASTPARSRTSTSAARTRPARTTATSRAWRRCWPGCRTRSPA